MTATVERTVVHSETDLTLRVARKWQEADGVVALTLEHPTGGLLPRWEPGAHVDVIVGDGSARQYSLCGDPRDRTQWTIAVLHESEGRGGSVWIHQTLVESQDIQIRGPRNHFHLDPAPRYLFIAGGIGVTPLLPMIATAEAAGADWRLVYGGRALENMAFRPALERYGDRVQFHPQSTSGRLDLAGLLGTPEEELLVYCCGPGSLLDAVEDMCAPWPRGSLYIERFSARENADEENANTAFEVELSISGRTLSIPADRTVLEVLEEEQVDIVSSCAEGTCGSCETVVLEGIPDHRDSVLSQDERDANDRMMVCVSRCRGSRLVLEL